MPERNERNNLLHYLMPTIFALCFSREFIIKFFFLGGKGGGGGGEGGEEGKFLWLACPRL